MLRTPTNGFVLLHRRVLESDLWELKSKQIVVAMVCLMNATWHDKEFMGMTIRRGQWLTHYHTIKERCPCDISIKEVRGSISILASPELGFLGTEVVTRLGRRYLLLTIKQYNTYQPEIYFDAQRGIWLGTTQGIGTGTRKAQGGHEKGTTLNEEREEPEQIENNEGDDLLERMIAVTGDPKDTLAFALLIKEHGRYWVEGRLGLLKEYIDEGKPIDNRAAYLTTLIKGEE